MSVHRPLGHCTLKHRTVVTLTAITMSAALLSPTAPTAYADEKETLGALPRAGVEQHPAAETPSLAWGIRGSFYRYVSGPTHVLDGAKQGQGNYFLWPHQSTTTQGNKLIIQYGGTVNFMKYCDGNKPARGACALDLTFADPRIEFDTTTGVGELYAKVHTKNYPQGYWSGPKTVQVGTVDTNAGRYNTDDKLTTWVGVSTKLTADGNAAFSDFYEEGGFLDSLNFSYPSVGEVTETQTGYNLRHRISTTTEYNGGNYVFTRTDGNVVVVSGQRRGDGTVHVFDKNLSKLNTPATIPLSAKGSSAYDTATDTLYWINGSQVYAAHTTPTGIGTPVELTQVPGSHVYGFAYSETTKQIGVISNKPGGKQGVDYEFHTISVSGTTSDTTSTVTLPTPRQLYPDVTIEERDDDIYGTTFGGDLHALRALPDGSFIAIHGHLLNTASSADRTGNSPIHITPTAATTARALTELGADLQTQGYRGSFSDNNGRIGIWSPLRNSVSIVRYNNATKQFTTDLTFAAPPEVGSIANATFAPDGSLVLVSESRSQAVFMDPATAQVTATASLSEHMKDTAQFLNQGAAFGPDGSLYILDRPVTPDYEEKVGLQLLTLPSEQGQRDNSVKPFDLTDTNRPDLSRENSDDEQPNVTTQPTPSETTKPAPSKPTPSPSGSSGPSGSLGGSWARTLEKALTNAGIPAPLAKLLSTFGWIGQLLFSPLRLLGSSR